MLTAAQICLLASREAKGGAGMVQIAGQYLNLVLQDLVLNRDLKVNRVTQMLTVSAGTNGPFLLESDYLRTYDMFYPLQTPNGMTQFLVPITMEQYDAEFKATQTANYPYEFATDLSTQVQVASNPNAGVVTSVFPTLHGIGYLAPPNTAIFDGASPGLGSGATATASLTAVGVLANSGPGFSVGDILTILGGTFTRPTTLLVTLGGASPTVSVLDGGSYSVVPGSSANFGGVNITGVGNTISASGGTGANYHPFIAWGVGDCHVTAGGTNYDYPFDGSVVLSGATNNVPAAASATVGQVVSGTAGNLFIYPQSNGTLVITHRYMKNQPDIVAPESSSVIPWFPYQDYLIKMTAARMMGTTGDDRQSTYIAECEKMLQPYLIQEGDEQQAVHAVRLDPRHFKSNRGLRPVKTNPY